MILVTKPPTVGIHATGASWCKHRQAGQGSS
jgi:hypothetical protein